MDSERDEDLNAPFTRGSRCRTKEGAVDDAKNRPRQQMPQALCSLAEEGTLRRRSVKVIFRAKTYVHGFRAAGDGYG